MKKEHIVLIGLAAIGGFGLGYYFCSKKKKEGFNNAVSGIQCSWPVLGPMPPIPVGSMVPPAVGAYIGYLQNQVNIARNKYVKCCQAINNKNVTI